MKTVLNMYLRNTYIDRTIEPYVSLPFDVIVICIRIIDRIFKVHYYISKGKIYRESTIYDDVFVDIVG